MLWSKIKHMFLPDPLSQRQIEHWNENGYLILEGFFGKAQLDALSAYLDNLWATRESADYNLVIDVLEGPLINKRMRLRDVPPETRGLCHKLNDLYLVSHECLELNLNLKLCEILHQLLDGEPMVINSLTFEKGSQQPHHFDTYYMPPPVKDKMAVSSICLEDHTLEAGPLSYYPGTHKIPPYVFSNGGIHAIDDEMPQARAYIEAEIKTRNLTRQTFVGKRGDVFLWHSQLYHGGLPIVDNSKTRKSLVTHYWRAQDVNPLRVARIGKARKYFKKEHHMAEPRPV